MQITIDFRASEPIYQQIVEQIRLMVANGELKKGDQLPTVRQLAADLRVNFNTVARAYRILDETGMISTQHGRGTYIWETLTAEQAEKLHQRKLSELVLNFLHETQRQGYSKQELTAEFQKQMAGWVEE